MQNNVVLKFSHPSGATSSKPSKAMTDALRQLSESSELQPLVAGARAKGRKVVVQVFSAANGCPFLIHLAAVPQDVA
jgi:hypothetical protein